MKKKAILLGTGFVVLGAFIWLSMHSFIELTPESPEDINYSLTAAGSAKTTNFKSANKVKKLVRKGYYEVLATQGEKSYLTVIKAGGFLGSSKTAVKLSPEKSRKFVGDNPSACMYYIGQVLSSVDCGDLYSQLRRHVPATAKQPTIVLKTPSSVDGKIEGLVATAEGAVAVLSSSTGSNHTGYIVRPDLSLTSPVVLTDLRASKAYAVQAYKQGFVAYDTSFEKIFYYTALSSPPSVITVNKSHDQKLVPYALKVQGDSIMLAYSNNAEDAELARSDDVEVSSKPNNKAAVTILIYNGSQTVEYNFKNRVSGFVLCGTKKLCLLNRTKQLDVYDIANTKPKLLFSLGAVDRIEPAKNGLLVAQKAGLLSLDVDKQEGFLQYSFGSYKFCGLRNDELGPTICVVNSTGKTAALSISNDSNNTDSIDKKAVKLAKLTDIKSLSIYDKFIYVSPNVGEVKYIPALKVFGYDPAITRAVKSRILQGMDAIGIDQTTYKVVSAFDN